MRIWAPASTTHRGSPAGARPAALALAALVTLGALGALLAGPAAAQDKTVYRCPGPPVLYTDALTPQQAAERGCRPIEGAPLTIVQTQPRPAPAASAPAPAARSVPNARVDPGVQRERDKDARRILNEELQREQAALAALRREYNDGQPERRGDERNYQRYLDRVAEMKAAIARKEADIAALQRELGKLGS
jgi:hypothetical protein